MLKRVICILFITTFLGACGAVVPPGKTVILLHPDGSTDIKTKGVYKAWGRTKLYFVDGKLKSFAESLKVLMADDINMDIDTKLIASFDVKKESIAFIKSKVPVTKVTSGDVTGFELSLGQFYKLAVRDILVGTTRNVVSTYITDDVRPNRKKIEAAIQKGVVARVKTLKYPINISGVLLSNIDYPESVKKMRESIKQVQLEETRKEAEAKAQIAAARRQVEVETEKAKSRIVLARARADENKIMTASLTPAFLMWRQFEVMEEIASKLGSGGNNTVFMMPYEMINQGSLQAMMNKQSIDALAMHTKAAK